MKLHFAVFSSASTSVVAAVVVVVVEQKKTMETEMKIFTVNKTAYNWLNAVTFSSIIITSFFLRSFLHSFESDND